MQRLMSILLAAIVGLATSGCDATTHLTLFTAKPNTSISLEVGACAIGGDFPTPGTDWGSVVTADCATISSFVRQTFGASLSAPVWAVTGFLPESDDPRVYSVVAYYHARGGNFVSFDVVGAKRFDPFSVEVANGLSYVAGSIVPFNTRLPEWADAVLLVGFTGQCAEEFSDAFACAENALYSMRTHNEPALCISNPIDGDTCGSIDVGAVPSTTTRQVITAPDPLVAGFLAPLQSGPFADCDFRVAFSGGVAPFQFEWRWSGGFVGSTSSVVLEHNIEGLLQAKITDAAGTIAFASREIFWHPTVVHACSQPPDGWPQ